MADCFQDILLIQNEEFVYAGTSAGAAAASKIYIAVQKRWTIKGEVKITSGLGLIDELYRYSLCKKRKIGRLFQF
jgi:cyanophycinase